MSIPVRAELEPLVSRLLNETAKLGYRLDQSQVGGYVCRPMKRTDGSLSDTPSNHSWGLAVDLNWRDNGFGSGASTNLPPSVIALWERNGFNWGGRWNTPDYMHFEFAGTPADAKRLAGSTAGEEDDVKLVVLQPDKPLTKGQFAGKTPRVLAIVGTALAFHLDAPGVEKAVKKHGPIVVVPASWLESMVIGPGYID